MTFNKPTGSNQTRINENMERRSTFGGFNSANQPPGFPSSRQTTSTAFGAPTSAGFGSAFGSTTNSSRLSSVASTTFGSPEAVVATNRPRSTTFHSFGDDLTAASGFSFDNYTREVAPTNTQLPPINKKNKPQEEVKKDYKFMLNTWAVLFKSLLDNNDDLNDDIIKCFINQTYIPDMVLNRLSNYNWSQIFNAYPHTKNIILHGCANHINGADYSEILYEAFELSNEYCSIELLRDIKKHLWIKKIYEEHPEIFSLDAKKEFKLEPSNYLLD